MKEKNKYEFKASTVDDATAIGLKELGLSREEADIEIKSYGGLFSKACVIITPKIIEKEESAEVFDAKYSETASDEAVKEDASIEEDDNKDEAVIGAEKAVFEFVTDLVYRMGLTSKVTSRVRGSEIYISIDGEDAGMIIGYRGEVLDAIQYYSLVIANKGEKNFLRVQVDAGNYRKRRQETLANLANRLARKAARTGRRTELEPMNPYERRIIHTTLLDDNFVTTESEGEGRYRHVVIIPKNKDNRGNRNRRSGEQNYQSRGYDSGGGYDSGYNNRREREYNRQEREYNRPSPEQESEADNADKDPRLASAEFRKKGFGKTRSFGQKTKRF